MAADLLSLSTPRSAASVLRCAAAAALNDASEAATADRRAGTVADSSLIRPENSPYSAFVRAIRSTCLRSAASVFSKLAISFAVGSTTYRMASRYFWCSCSSLESLPSCLPSVSMYCCDFFALPASAASPAFSSAASLENSSFADAVAPFCVVRTFFKRSAFAAMREIESCVSSILVSSLTASSAALVSEASMRVTAAEALSMLADSLSTPVDAVSCVVSFWSSEPRRASVDPVDSEPLAVAACAFVRSSSAEVMASRDFEASFLAFTTSSTSRVPLAICHFLQHFL